MSQSIESKTAPAFTTQRVREHTVLRMLVEGTATETGQNFFSALVRCLASALDTHGAWVTEYLRAERALRPLAFWMGDRFGPTDIVPIEGTPCEAVIERLDLVHFPDNVIGIYPKNDMLRDSSAISYLGYPLLDASGTVLGHVAVLDTKPMPADPTLYAVFRIFAARAAAELQRINAEAALREREAKLDRIVNGAMDGIIELDAAMRITHINPAGEKVFGAGHDRMVGRPFADYLHPTDCDRLAEIIAELNTCPEGAQQRWIAGGLNAMRADREAFAAEATLSRVTTSGATHHTLVLRNVNDRLDAERKIEALTVETAYLREEIRDLQNHGDILGNSPAVRRVMEDIIQVARTDATVLILGETGTGKELVARAIHNASKRAAGPLIRVNCAAIPASLMESEFFGHEKGAFTGATAKREGRFALAHNGTLFLDEVGELPLDLQAKLLRVLQDGEFEPVGGSHTRKVDVRVIAATNRLLEDAVKRGAFRKDLYYRLNVFPIQNPPLRDRGEDIALLAQAFADRFARRLGRKIAPLTPQDARRLTSYTWPGNVRELQNIMERAVITARDGKLNLERCLPEPAFAAQPAAQTPDAAQEILTSDDLRALERSNIVRALESARWKISGDTGAAKLLGMNPSTLASRMKALEIERV